MTKPPERATSSRGAGARSESSATPHEARDGFTPILVGLCACTKPLPRPGALWCSDGCSKRREDRRAKDPRKRVRKSVKKAPRFTYAPIGIDGEGEDGRYTLLAASNQEGEHLFIERREGLSTLECLQFIVDLPAKPYLFGFAFTYDVNMILSSLSPDELFTLAQWGRVYWHEWRIGHVPGKALTITHRPTKTTRIIWDLYPWIQSSFVTMLGDFALADKATLARIAAMKDRRANFAEVPMATIRSYCLEECALLARAVRLLLDLITESGYSCTVFYSPGSLAAAVMKAHEVNDYRLAGEGGVLRTALEEAYVGARAEVAVVGPIDGPLYEYDINSAYPYAATQLPCFAHGVWRKFKSRAVDEITDTTLVRVRWTCKGGIAWGPFPVRPRVGSLRFPTSGEAWIWGREARVGARICETFEIVAGWQWVVKCDHRPFAYLEGLYDKRRELVDVGNALEYVYKLILNSTYGKVAQRPYGDADPTWRFMPWAGLITSNTRATLLEEIIAVGPKHVYLCATDCLVTDKPLKVEVSKRLGAWGVQEYDGMFVAGPGFYEASKPGAKAKVRNRGISRSMAIDKATGKTKPLEFDELKRAWQSEGREGKVDLATRRFIGYRQALQYMETEALWRKFIDVPMRKTMTLEPRREWRTGDPMDGRSRAPSAEYIERHEVADMIDRVLTMAIASDAQEDLIRRIVASDELQRRSLFDAAEQPDWLIDEFQHG